MVQVIGLDAAFDESPHQRFERRRVVIDTAQQHGLADHGNAGVDDAGAGGAGLAGQLTRMIGVQRDPGHSTRNLERRDHLAADARRFDDRHTRVNADDPDVVDRGQIRHDLGKPPRRQHQGIAAGQDHLPDFGMRADIGQRIVVGAFRERARLARPDHFAAKTEPAIHRADMHQLEQHPIGVAMHDARDRRMRVITDRIGAFVRLRHQFLGAWNKLPRDRIVGIVGVDQRGHIRRHRYRVARRDLFQIGKILNGNKALGDQFRRLPQRRDRFEIDAVHASPAGGVQTT